MNSINSQNVEGEDGRSTGGQEEAGQNLYDHPTDKRTDTNQTRHLEINQHMECEEESELAYSSSYLLIEDTQLPRCSNLIDEMCDTLQSLSICGQIEALKEIIELLRYKKDHQEEGLTIMATLV